MQFRLLLSDMCPPANPPAWNASHSVICALGRPDLFGHNRWFFSAKRIPVAENSPYRPRLRCKRSGIRHIPPVAARNGGRAVPGNEHLRDLQDHKAPEISPLHALRFLRRKNGPSLSLGRQLRGREEPRVLRALADMWHTRERIPSNSQFTVISVSE